MPRGTCLNSSAVARNQASGSPEAAFFLTPALRVAVDDKHAETVSGIEPSAWGTRKKALPVSEWRLSSQEATNSW